MKRTLVRGGVAATAAALLLTLAACKQPDGPMPVPAGEQPNKIEDISRDLQNVASKDANAPGELADDLSSVDPMRRPPERIVELSKTLSAALGGKSLEDDEAKRIANLLFVVLAGRDLSESQIDQISGDLRTTLTGVGADAQAAQRAADTAEELTVAITRNKKRWYHR